MPTAMAPAARPRNVSRPQPARSTTPPVNVGDTERWLSALGGSVLTWYGLNRGSLTGVAMALFGGALAYRGVSGHCTGYATLGISTADPQGSAASVEAGQGTRVDKTFTINRAPEELYRVWHNFEGLPRFMSHLQAVVTDGPGRSHWIAKAPLGKTVEWDAQIINEKENELIAWRSLPGSAVDHAGSVHFRRAPDGRGTEVKVELKYDPPAGKLGTGIAWLLGSEPGQQIQEDLRRFKQIMEAGEAPTTVGQPSCRAS